MASRLIQLTKLPDGYELYVFDSGHSGVQFNWFDVELSSREWIAFTGRVSVDAKVDPKSKQAAAIIITELLDKAPLNPTLTDDQKDFLAGTEAIKLRAWCDTASDSAAETQP